MSIRLKFFIILSLLMAAVLLLQFYFTNKAQKEMVEEIGKISTSFNSATENYYEVLLQNLEKQDSTETKFWKNFGSRNNFYWQGKNDKALQFQFNVDKIKQMSDSISKVVSGYHYSLEKEAKEMQKAVEVLKVFGSADDSGSHSVHTIDVDLNVFGDDDSAHAKQVIVTNMPPKTSSTSFSFRVPDFSIPTAPRIIHYNYDTAALQESLAAARNRNILITLLVFLFSSGLIFLISSRFQKPIGNLRTAFNRVVAGDLEVSVPVRTRDEIGDLTGSFNQMVEELRKNREKEIILKRKERLASLGQLAAGVAHEVKNPLNAINLTIEHLKDKYSTNDAAVQKYIGTIQKEIVRLDNVVNNFLNFVRSENLQKKDTDVNALVNEVLLLLERELSEHKIRLATELDEKFFHSLDSERFKTVLMNIVLNAIQAMPEGGELKVSSDDAQKSIKISDSGTGIPETNLENIFGLFYTTKPGGTGLGLPTAYKIVREHDGEISIQSEIGKGTEVTIQL